MTKLTEIDEALEQARQAQEQEHLQEQVRMERLHVATMLTQGMLASGDNPEKATIRKAVKLADTLLREVMK